MKRNATDDCSSYTYSDDTYSDDSDTYTSGLHSGASCSGRSYGNLILDSGQEKQLEEAGIDSFEFEMMDEDEKIEALEDAGLDPFDFDIY